ncbi:MAG: molybdopterin-binding protein [Proteobacteria bacterium]|nr:molybdopterin-binding protein [Pseudomonadota bacterium]
MQIVPIKKAVGMVLGYDITEIIPGQFKGAAFKKGHIIHETDIPKLLNIGKKHIYVVNLSEDMIHENEAARRMAEAAIGCGVTLSDPSEGKIELLSTGKGLLKVNAAALEQINLLEGIMFATIHGGHIVQNGQKLGGTRIIPLAIPQKDIETVEHICESFYPVITVKPVKPHTIGIVTTGSEVYHGRIEDKFGPVLEKKFNTLGSHILRQVIVDDDIEMIAGAIRELIKEGADFIATTGGMSVDPDDVTPSGIKAAGGSVLTYGAPVLPGAMFLLAEIDGIPIVGLPACVMYVRTSIFDLIVPRLLANETVTRLDIARLGYGGCCMGCEECRYPKCGFGKGD